jgi:hypothetical protein
MYQNNLATLQLIPVNEAVKWKEQVEKWLEEEEKNVFKCNIKFRMKL